MRYYSDKLNKLFDTEEALSKAEQALVEEQKRKEQLKTVRAERAKEVEAAIEHANELLEKFIEDYGSYHTSVKADDWFNKLVSLFF